MNNQKTNNALTESRLNAGLDIIFPEQPSDDVILAMLRVEFPASYKNGLFSKNEGPKTKGSTEKLIEIAKSQYIAIRETLMSNV